MQMFNIEEAVQLRASTPLSFTRRVRVEHESGHKYETPITYNFDFDNGLRNKVPVSVWEEIRDCKLDQFGTKYSDILKEQ